MKTTMSYKIVGVDRAELTINGFKMTDSISMLNHHLQANGLDLIPQEAYHWSTTLGRYIRIADMNPKHVENHLIKNQLFDKWQLDAIANNDMNTREYLKVLLKDK